MNNEAFKGLLHGIGIGIVLWIAIFLSFKCEAAEMVINPAQVVCFDLRAEQLRKHNWKPVNIADRQRVGRLVRDGKAEWKTEQASYWCQDSITLNYWPAEGEWWRLK